MTPEARPKRRGLRRSLSELRRSAGDVAEELRRDYEARFADAYGQAPAPDPALQTLFHTLGVQISRIYQDAESVFPEAVLDDLIGGTGREPRLATPAQTVLQFSEIRKREPITRYVQVGGRSSTGEMIWFAPDEDFELAPASVRFVGIAEGGELKLLSGAVLPDGSPLPPARVRTGSSGEPPTLYVALDLGESHLRGVGLFLNIDPGRPTVAEAFHAATWCLLGPEGGIHGDRLLRSRPARGGVRDLFWFDAPTAPEVDAAAPARTAHLGSGPFGGMVYRFPDVPLAKRVTGMPPPSLSKHLGAALPEGEAEALEEPLVWLQVSLSGPVRSLSAHLDRVEVNCISASNLNTEATFHAFGQRGEDISFRPQGQKDTFLMGLVSVIGSRPYGDPSEAEAENLTSAGTFTFRDGRVSIVPGVDDSGKVDDHVQIVVGYCDGVRANNLEVGQVSRLHRALDDNVGARVENLTVTKGGADPPDYPEAALLFAQDLRTGDRIVTAADFEISARAFDARIASVETHVISEATEHGVQIVEVVHGVVSRHDFVEPDDEVPRLSGALERHFGARIGLGRVVRVELETRP